MGSPRTQARELVLQALYAWECGEVEPAEDFSNIVEEDVPSEKALAYARDLFLMVRKHLAWADEQIEALAENWRLERIATIDRNIMRLTMVELQHMVDVPVKVAINEAIEMAKKFSTPQSSSFVNGILDSFAKKIGQADSPESA